MLCAATSTCGMSEIPNWLFLAATAIAAAVVLVVAGAAAARDMRAAFAELNAGNACTEEDE